jgi:hypothetical protein
MLSAIMGRAFMRYVPMLGMTLALVGCASNTWLPGPNVNPNMSFEQQRAQCSMMEHQAGSIGEAGRINQNFNDCMLASGWVPASQECRTPSDKRVWLPRCT